MNNIPSAGERAYQEANGKGREIAASVTDKSVAELVFLTAPWAGGKRERTSATRVRQGCCLHTHKHTHTEARIETGRPRLHQEKFREETDLEKVGWRKLCLWIRPNVMAFLKLSLVVL